MTVYVPLLLQWSTCVHLSVLILSCAFRLTLRRLVRNVAGVLVDLHEGREGLLPEAVQLLPQDRELLRLLLSGRLSSTV